MLLSTNSNLTSNLHQADRGQTLAPINLHWWQIASRAVPSLLFSTRKLQRLRWNWPSWRERERKKEAGGRAQGSSCGNSNLQPRTRKHAETLWQSAQRLPRSWQRKCSAHVIKQHANATKWIWSPIRQEEVRLPRPSRLPPPKKSQGASLPQGIS